MATNSNLEVHQFPCLEDNYGYLLHDPDSGFTASIDTPEVTAIEHALQEKGWRLTHILNTHHHFDHAGGNLELKEKTDAVIIGPRKDARRIPGIDIHVGNKGPGSGGSAGSSPRSGPWRSGCGPSPSS